MRIGRYAGPDGDRPRLGLRESDGTVVDLARAGEGAGIGLPRETRRLFDGWGWRRKVELAREFALETGIGLADADRFEAMAPIAAPSKVVCVGLNYRDHAAEGDNPIPDEPVLFTKFPSAINDPGGRIRWDPELTDRVDYEGELVIVVDREARRVPRSEAMAYVAGYTVGNDVTARDLQRRDGQWVRGKSLDTFAPIGPEIVTPDEVDDVHDLAIRTDVNGERMQASSTGNLIFGVEELVAFCSRAFTLHPGDLIFTGTPPGVGTYRDPPVYLSDGDTVTVGIEGIGELTNVCSPTNR